MEFFPFPTSEKRSVSLYLASDDNEKCKLQFQTFVIDAFLRIHSVESRYLNLLKKIDTFLILHSVTSFDCFAVLKKALLRHVTKYVSPSFDINR